MWGPCSGHKRVTIWPFLWLLIHWVVKWKPGHSCRPLVLLIYWPLILLVVLCNKISLWGKFLSNCNFGEEKSLTIIKLWIGIIWVLIRILDREIYFIGDAFRHTALLSSMIKFYWFSHRKWPLYMILPCFSLFKKQLLLRCQSLSLTVCSPLQTWSIIFLLCV